MRPVHIGEEDALDFCILAKKRKNCSFHSSMPFFFGSRLFFLFAKVSPKEMAIYVSNETYITQVDSPEAVLSLVQMVTLFKLSL